MSSIHRIVIGTAGHIDHGKSSLVRAMTGVDPDRLPEEKERGLTVDLGFAPLDLPGGLRIGIVDVPGHERFIKNMVAGATGIDFVILVIAADDGVMPQTREHLEIMDLLGVERGVIALNKVDLVEKDFVDLVEEDIRHLLQGTFLEKAPIFRVAATTGEGIEPFQAEVTRLARETQPRPADGVFRMPIQRVFSAKGFGTVVTGIPISGGVKKDDVLEILPPGLSGKVRGMQAYKQKTEEVQAGHSSAVNLADIDYRQVHRGMVVASPGYFRPTKILEARLKILKRWSKPIPDRTEIRLHVGTTETLGILVPLESKALAPGEESLVQLRLREPVVVAEGDRFVLRLATPPATVGGGVVVSTTGRKLKQFRKDVHEGLEKAASSLGNRLDWIRHVLERSGTQAVSLEDLLVETHVPREEILGEVEKLGKEVIAIRPGRLFLHRTGLEQAGKDVQAALEEYFQQNPNRLVMPLNSLRGRARMPVEVFSFVLDQAAQAKKLSVTKGEVRLPSKTASLSHADEMTRLSLKQLWEQSGFSPPTLEEAACQAGANLPKVKELTALLVDEGELIRSGSLFFSATAEARARQAITENIRAHGELDIPSLRDQLGTTRKFLIPLLEHFDAVGLTLRQGGRRILKQS